jgi:hypothetical protein
MFRYLQKIGGEFISHINKLSLPDDEEELE